MARHQVVLSSILALSVVTTTAQAAPGWKWPLEPRPAILERFNGPPAPWAPGHRGVDLKAGPRAPVLAPAEGTVVFTGVVVDRGVITIEHPSGLRSSFEPVTQALPVGSQVTAGERVAVIGSGGHCSGRCLHWGVRRGEEYLDPLRFVARRMAVLLPDSP